MVREFHPGRIVPESGLYRIIPRPQHAEVPQEMTAIKGRRFPTWGHCKRIRL